MSFFTRFCGVISLLVLLSGYSFAATPKEIVEAIRKGVDALKKRNYSDLDIGRTALAGIAMLEGETSINDPSLKTITERVRTASWSQFKTYELSLCLIYLDRLGDPKDEVLIQILAVRLLAGQTPFGGWNSYCITEPNQKEVEELRAIKPIDQEGKPKLHPEVEKYQQKLVRSLPPVGKPRGDTSDIQFAIIAVWLSRKHGVPVEAALQAVETKFMTTQAETGGWAYLPDGNTKQGLESASPSMHCVGLMGLATAIALREERRVKESAELRKAGNKKPIRPRPDERDEAISKAFAGLGKIVTSSAETGQGSLVLDAAKNGSHDLYFYWSLECVCAIYGVEKFRNVDWFEAGANTLVAKQAANGTWTEGGSYGVEVNTSFAVLFLLKSNLARDLRKKIPTTQMFWIRPDPKH